MFRPKDNLERTKKEKLKKEENMAWQMKNEQIKPNQNLVNPCVETYGVREIQQKIFLNKITPESWGHVKAVVFGDHHVQNINPSSIASTFRLKEDVSVVKIGVPGILISELLYLIRQNLSIFKNNLADVKYIVCAIGSSDMGGTQNKGMIEFIAQALMLLQQRLREVFPTASIILYQPIPPLNASGRAYECLYQALYRSDDKSFICPIRSILVNKNRNYFYHGENLNRHGHNAILEHLIDVVENENILYQRKKIAKRNDEYNGTEVVQVEQNSTIDLHHPLANATQRELIHIIEQKDVMIKKLQNQIADLKIEAPPHRKKRNKNKKKRTKKDRNQPYLCDYPEMCKGGVFKPLMHLRAKNKTHPHRTFQEWQHLFPRYPSHNGYAYAVPHNSPEIPELFKKYGFVVLDNILSPQEIEDTKIAIVEEAYQASCKYVKIDDPNTWVDEYWGNYGKYKFPEPAMHDVAFKNRCNLKLYKFFSKLYGTKHLHSSLDSFGVSRPTKNVLINGIRMDRPDWKCELPPHWDYNLFTWLENIENGLKPTYQGVIQLTDAPVGSGGHFQVPGSCHFVEEWCENNYYSDIPKKASKPYGNENYCNFKQEIGLRPGQCIVWLQSSMHGVLPNNSDKLRLVQYVRLYPAEEYYKKMDNRDCTSQIDRYGYNTNTLKRRFTKFQQNLLGLRPWKSFSKTDEETIKNH